MHMARIAYVRVSSVDQNEQRQVEALTQFNIDKWFIEKVSARDTNRLKLTDMLDYVREGDTVYVHDFSRLARSTSDLLMIVEHLKRKGVNLISGKENFDTSTATGKLMLTMIAAINAFERENLLERQREGIAIAVRQGKYKGRKEVTVKDFDKHYARYMSREVTKQQLASELKISRPTLDRLIAEHKEKQPVINCG
jgi:DNA invertase Pin-like site-specific DNA recombinase